MPPSALESDKAREPAARAREPWGRRAGDDIRRKEFSVPSLVIAVKRGGQTEANELTCLPSSPYLETLPSGTDGGGLRQRPIAANRLYRNGDDEGG